MVWEGVASKSYAGTTCLWCESNHGVGPLINVEVPLGPSVVKGGVAHSGCYVPWYNSAAHPSERFPVEYATNPPARWLANG